MRISLLAHCCATALTVIAGSSTAHSMQASRATTHTSILSSAQSQVVDLQAGESWSLTRKAPFPSRDLGLWFTGEFAQAEVELIHNAQTLETWPLHEDLDQAPAQFSSAELLKRPAHAKSVTGLVHSYEGAFDSARLTIFGPAHLTSLDLVWIAPGAQLASPTASPQAPKAAAYPKPAISSRSSWGADAPQCGASFCNTTHIAIHHTASSSDYAATTWNQAAANVKAIQSYHMYTNGWCDIGYNYLVTKQGWIFEGRGGGDDVKGAHDGFNCGSMGVASLGYFHSPVNNPPTTALLDALAELGAWKCDSQGIDPQASSFYSGLGAIEQNVYGHRDVKSTACPGDLLYGALPQLRSLMASKLGGAPTSGTLKGVLYDANLGTSVRLVGTVALANGDFVKTGNDGYFEFPLQAGTYQFAATAPGHTAKAASETITTGDAWESIGLAQGAVPFHTSSSTGPSSFVVTFQGDPGSPVFLGYSLIPGIPIAPLSSAGKLWLNLATAQSINLGTIPVSGTLSINLNVTGAPAGLNLHTQGYLISNGQVRLTNGAAWRSQ